MRIRIDPVSAAILAAVVGGAFVRFRGLGEPDLWLDEILHFRIATEAAGRPLVDWLIGFERENGSLFYALQLLARLLPSGLEFQARVIAALAGTATIWLIGEAGRKLAGDRVGVVAALLLAGSPLHVVYSREGRPYALILLATALFLRGAVPVEAGRGWAWGGCLAILASPLLGAMSAPFVIGSAPVLGLACWAEKEGRRRRFLAPLLATLLSLLLFPALYGRFPRGAVEDSAGGSPLADSLRIAVEGCSSTGRDAPSWSVVGLLFAAFAAAGAVALVRRNRIAGGMALGLALAPPLVAAVTLVLLDHWISARYLAFGLVSWLLLIAAGLDWLATLLLGERSRTTLVVAALALMVAIPLAIRGERQAREKVPWRELLASIAERHRPPELVVAASDWSFVCLSFYDEQLGTGLPIWNARGKPDWAGIALRKFGSGWLVVAGYLGEADFSEVSRGLYEVRRVPAEGCGLWFAPGRDELERRAPPTGSSSPPGRPPRRR